MFKSEKDEQKKKNYIIAVLLIILIIVAMLFWPKEIKDTIVSKTNLNKQKGYIEDYTGPKITTVNGISWRYVVYDEGISVSYVGGTTGKTLTIPSSIDGYKVTMVHNGFNQYPGLESVIIPNTVTKIYANGFQGCSSLKSITIPNSITSIGNYAFSGCSSLTSITLPINLKEIGAFSFYGCTGLTSITIPKGVTTISYNMFSNCTNLKNVVIPNSVKTIETSAFSGCTSLTNVTIPNSVTSIGSLAFQRCSGLKEITIPNGVISIESQVFNQCSSLTSIEIPSSVTSIEGNAFRECSSLTSIEIPSSVRSIEGNAFRECSSLTSIKIPEGIMSVGEDAFYTGNNLTKIIMETVIDSGSKTIQEVELPYILKRMMNKEDELYIGDEFELTSCSLNKDKTKLNIDTEVANKEGISLKVTSGRLDKLEYRILVQSGTITYNYTGWIKGDVIATLHIKDGEIVQNNNGSNKYTFSKNGIYTFIYLTKEGKEVSVIAKVTKIDKNPPTLEFEGNPTEWTKEDTIFNIVTTDENESGIENITVTDREGHFSIVDNNNKKFKVETNGTYTITVTDRVGNTKTKTVEVTKIDKFAPTIKKIEGNPTEWTKGNVVLTVNAEDNLSGLAEKAYSFDGGKTWQEENIKAYTDNTSGIVIQVKDFVGNIETYSEKINITNIDKENPVINKVEGNPTEWTKGNVILTVNAEDNLSGLAEKAYSFDGGKTWQEENNKTYTENTSGIVIQVKDKLGNITEYKDTIDITKITKLEEITINKAPDKTEYIEGQNFDSTGMIVTAKYDNGTTEEIANYQMVNGSNLVAGKTSSQTSVIIQYTRNGVTKTTKQEITVVKKALEKIAISKAPDKIEYVEGQSFDTTGMVVTAIYDNGTTAEIRNYTVKYGEKIVLGQPTVIISYTENGVTKTAAQQITVVKKALEGITISKAPDKTEYVEGQNFEKTGMVVTATYDNGTTAEIRNYTVKYGEKITLGQPTVIISYTEDEVTKTAAQEIAVTKKGDTDGDNKVDFMDILAINKHRLGKAQLAGIYLEAADVTGDGKVDFMDILQINKYRLGKINSL